MMTTTGIHLPLTLTFVETDDEFSVYRTPEGENVYLAHGTGKVLVPFHDLDLEVLWQEFLCDEGNLYRYTSWNSEAQEAFRTRLEGLTFEPEFVEDVGFCVDCSRAGHVDDMCSTNEDNGEVCEACTENYHYCEDCEERYRYTTTTLNDSEVCEHCRGRNWSFCDDCDGYYPDHAGDEHQHDEEDDCECESPAQQFMVRNDGEPLLANDVQVTVTLPAGVISDEGIGAIAGYLRDAGWQTEGDEATRLHTLSYDLEVLGERWQTKEGNYTKRLSRHAYKAHALKIKPEILSRVGNIASEHSTSVDVLLAVTRNLNLPRADFAHESSCWWTDYSESRCALKTNGGYALRTFTKTAHGVYVSGRAWVMPLLQTLEEQLTPTFETEAPDAFVVFNGYGELEGYAPARIVSHMAGMTYRKIEFSVDPMYINADSGYLVAPEEIASKYTDGALHLDLAQHANLFHNEKKVLSNA